MWQYTSKGTVPGISGNVDMNIAYFRYGAVAEPKHVHDFANGEFVRETLPTCTTKGERIVRCACGDVEVTELAQLEHQYVVIKITEATTTVDGEKIETCELCGDTKTTVIEATGIEEEEPNLENEIENEIENELANELEPSNNNMINDI